MMETLMSLIKVVLLSKYVPKYKTSFNRKERCLIIGNGPSVNSDIDEIERIAPGMDRLAVNYFSPTQLYDRLKPNLYVIVSSDYWRKDKNEGWSADRQEVFTAMVEKTTWKMTLFVPMIAKKAKEWRKYMAQNENITIQYFNLTPVEGSSAISKYLIQNRWGMPRPHNVMVGGVLVATLLKYSKVYLTGVEHSWLLNLFVDEDNIPKIGQKHFYEKEVEGKSTLLRSDPKPMFKENTGEPRRLHEILEKFYYTFRSYHELKDLAKRNGVELYNLTEGSFIDAFERTTIKDVK